MKQNKKIMTKLSLKKPENLDLEKLINPNITYSIPIHKGNSIKKIGEYQGGDIIKFIPVMYFFIHRLIERQYSGYSTITPKLNSIRMYGFDIKPLMSENNFQIVRCILEYLGILYINSKKVISVYTFETTPDGYFCLFNEQYINVRIVRHEICVKADTQMLNKLAA